MIKGIIFDLDGTLIDTISDIGKSVNAVLEDYGYKTYPLSAYRDMVGHGFAVLIKKAMPKGLKPEQYEEALAKFTYYYDQYYMDSTRPYPDIQDLLNKLKERGLKLAVNSNKRNDYTEKLIKHFFPDIPFTAVFGARENIPNKPDPYTALEIIAMMGLNKEEVLYIGDSETDINTGHNAGLKTVGVAWGFSDYDKLRALNPDFLVNQAADILKIINE